MKNERELVENGGKLINKQNVEHALCRFYLRYMKLVLKTGKYELINGDLLQENVILGFWHGDSYCMQFVLRDISRRLKNLKVIVTSRVRGNYIEEMIKFNGGEALRLPDGLEMRSCFHDLLKEASKNGNVIAAALDGPSGPHEDPKKLIFLLAQKSGKRVVCVHFRFHRVWRVHARWDHFKVPLPFGRITAELQDMGEITPERLRNFNEIKDTIIRTI